MLKMEAFIQVQEKGVKEVTEFLKVNGYSVDSFKEVLEALVHYNFIQEQNQVSMALDTFVIK
jgi:hypothetical protein